MFPVALAPEPALEPHPLRDDHVVGGYLARVRAALPGKGGESLDLMRKFAFHCTFPQ
jgi:hypothetical protein